MSKRKIVIVSVLAVALLGAVGYFVFKDDTKPTDGIYKVENFASYPDAYVEIKEGSAQFFNIDLNALYKDKMVERYINYITNPNEEITEDDRKEIEASIDLNKMFCEKSVLLDYDIVNMRDDEKHYLYYYTFGIITDVDHMSYSYNTKEKIITLIDETNAIVFNKQ